MDIVELKTKTMSELLGIADELDIPSRSNLKKQELIFKILEAKTDKLHLMADALVKYETIDEKQIRD